MLTKARFIDLGPYSSLAVEGGYRARSLGDVNEEGTLVTRRQRVFTRALVVLVPFESKVGAGWHVKGGSRTTAGSADVTRQVRRSDIDYWAITLLGSAS